MASRGEGWTSAASALQPGECPVAACPSPERAQAAEAEMWTSRTNSLPSASQRRPSAIAVVGHCSHDALVLHSGEVKEALGGAFILFIVHEHLADCAAGSVAYICSILASVEAVEIASVPSFQPPGDHCAVQVIPLSKVGVDFKYSHLLAWSPLRAFPASSLTTRFVCDSSPDALQAIVDHDVGIDGGLDRLDSALQDALNNSNGNAIDEESHPDRLEFVETVCDPILPVDIQHCIDYTTYRATTILNDESNDSQSPLPYLAFDIVCAVGIVNEIQIETLRLLHAQSRLVVVDVQGFIRHIPFHSKAQQKMRFAVNYQPLSNQVLQLADFVKAGQSELQYIDISTAIKYSTLLITQGGDKPGCRILNQKMDIFVPGFNVPASHRVDATGCGDAFLAGLVLGLAAAQPLPICAMMGNYFGALTIQAIGIPNISSFIASKVFDIEYLQSLQSCPLLV